MELDLFAQEFESKIRLGFFIAIFTTMALWEILAPRRELTVNKSLRWANNILLVVTNTLVLRLLFPTAALGTALWVSGQGWGLLSLVNWPYWLEVLIAVVVLDFFIYLQHVMVHAVPTLWRLHRVHHADLDFDVTTGARFHPIEIILSMLIKFAVIILIGPALFAVLVFEVILNVMAMFNHSNIRFPLGLDRVLRLFVVTPDMHRVHHSVEHDETNSNFGFNLSLWDRLFGTYKAQPEKGHTDMTIGIDTFREKKQATYLPGLLMLPFLGKSQDYTINRRDWTK